MVPRHIDCHLHHGTHHQPSTSLLHCWSTKMFRVVVFSCLVMTYDTNKTRNIRRDNKKGGIKRIRCSGCPSCNRFLLLLMFSLADESGLRGNVYTLFHRGRSIGGLGASGTLSNRNMVGSVHTSHIWVGRWSKDWERRGMSDEHCETQDGRRGG